MSSIIDSIQQQITVGAAQQVSQRFGLDPAVAQHAISVAVPAITAALAAHARSGGADAIHQQATKQVAADAQSVQSAQVLGDQHAAVAQRVSDATGISREDAGKILNTVAPAVMRGIGEHVQQQGIDSAQLSNALAGATAGSGPASAASPGEQSAGI
jgi:hypothetical protein